MGGVVKEWVYTRPTMEAIGEEAFEKSAIESSTIFRIESVDKNRSSLLITPTVSNHWLLVPCQTINGYTVGLAYLDVLYERKDPGNCVPALKLGRFVLEDRTGEAFLTGWRGNIMIVYWIQSIIKCERVCEILLFQAPPVDGMKPKRLLLRNSFYERRDCRLCGRGPTVGSLGEACSGVNNRLSHDPTAPAPLTNMATLYRRFRGGYFGICIKTRYDQSPILQEVQPVFVDVRHGLNVVKKRFKNSLRRNVAFVMDGASSVGFFGVNPRSGSRVMFLRAAPVESGYPLIAMPSDGDADDISDDGSRKSGDPYHDSPQSVQQDISSIGSFECIDARKGPRRRVRVEDDLNRRSLPHLRKVRNRESAARSNRIRKMRIEQTKNELQALKGRIPGLEGRLRELHEENRSLRMHALGIQSQTRLGFTLDNANEIVL